VRVNPIGIIFDPECLLHDTGPGHAESSARLQCLLNMLGAHDVQLLRPTILPGRLATESEILRVHSPAHWRRIKATAGYNVRLDNDTVASPRSFDAALRAAGCAIAATESVVSRQVRSAFAFIRPPGHHAEPDKPMGFCLFNNVAVAARHARAALGLQRVAIVDFDVHHGNGTQVAFYNDPYVLYISTHQHPLYPGTGAAGEVGEGLGRGRTINIPLRGGHGDAEYDAIYGSIVARILERFRPELILVSAGFDIAAEDPLGSMEVTSEGFARIAAHLVAAAEMTCGGRIVFALEGGYSLMSLQDGIFACLEAMAGMIHVDEPRGSLSSLPLGDAGQYLDVYREFFPI